MKRIILALGIVAAGFVIYIVWDEIRLHSVRAGDKRSDVVARLGAASHSERHPGADPLYLPVNSACRARAIAETLVYERGTTLRPSLFVYLGQDGQVECVERPMLVKLQG